MKATSGQLTILVNGSGLYAWIAPHAVSLLPAGLLL
jgi:hypothetical protein